MKKYLYIIILVLFAMAGNDLSAQTAVSDTVEYDAESNTYIKITRLGDMVINREYMTFDEYQDYRMSKLMKKYWDEKNGTTDGGGLADGLLGKIPGFDEVSKKLEGLMGKPELDIKPTGSVDLTFQIVNDYRDDPSLDPSQRSHTHPDFDENIQLSAKVKIGDLFNFDLNWNTQATFDFENKIKLRYEGKEDDILQLFEAADISFPLNTTLIHGSQQLFGFHTKLKFGKLTIDAVASEKETSTENMQVQGGASSREFEIRADEYEENRHYFLAQYFYNHYNKAMSTLPVVNSNIKIIRLEVWRTNVGAAVTNNRNILALKDLGEHEVSSPGLVGNIGEMPSNMANNIFQVINANSIRPVSNITNYMQGVGFVSGTDYEKVESARLLNSSEYTFNEQMGFISLHQPLTNDQVLAVAFQYQVIGDTNVYQVGELTTDGVNDPSTLVVKLIKGTSVNTHSSLWKLMMKNVYFLKSSQLSRDHFRLNILYENPEGGMGIGYFTEGPKEGVPLIEVFGFDRMDATQSYYYADGVFDWFDSAAYKGGTIQASTGRIFFPYVEPFGKDLREILGDADFAKQYCFDSLYTMTQALARQYADKNKFYLEGYYSTSVSGTISLGYSVTPGSVTVTGGGVPLIENVDYTVDYTMGTVTIINEGILSSNTPISVSSENNSFSMMTKRMLGLHLNYEFEKDFNLGATVMNLFEKPLTKKNNFGEEPTSNTIWGMDLNYRHEVPWITKAIDFLPGIQTKAPSNLTLQAEVAHFIPGMASTGGTEGKVSYVDDFEGAESSIDLKGMSYWSLASTPQDYNTPNPLFPETRPDSGLGYGFNRARTAWYRISDSFYGTNTPENITVDDRSNPYARRIMEKEVFPNKDLVSGTPSYVFELNLAYYPDERGPYNYDVAPTTYSAGVAANGRLNDPKSRWGGIMRSLEYTDFESQNIETLEFWLMDPFIDTATGQTDPNIRGGKFYINLGDISEDILRDGRKAFENGNSTSDVIEHCDTTIWGRVPTIQPIVNAFENDESARKYQDVGYDGLSSTHGIEDEQSFFASYLQSIQLLHGTSSEAYIQALADPSSDDYRYFFSTYADQNDLKINDRYKYFNNPEGNSPADADNPEAYPTHATTYPNVEDINRDNTLSEAENYYQYEIDLTPSKMVIGENYIVDIQQADNIQLANGQYGSCKWYQFRIPIREPDKVVGKINGYQSIRFMRMFLRDFEDPVILRFATLELVYGTWRKYTEDLLQPGDYATGTGASTTFSISTVNVEENGARIPIPYCLPPGIDRESWYNTNTSYTKLNEQALSMDITDLASGDARAVYRNTTYDLRNYGKLKMFVHAEKKNELDQLNDDDLRLFVRLGSDYTNNYYEYEVPLKLTPWYTSAEARDVVWPVENNVEVDLERMVDIKTERNRLIRSGNTEYASTLLYSEYVDGHKYTVLGAPNLGKVKVIMVGVRNPKKETLTDGNDMLPKSAIVWLNELRLSDFKNRGGWAAMALARTNLADVGNISLYSSYRTAGFGNLEDNLTSLELINTFNFQSTLDFQLDKFLPEDWGLHIPLYLDISKEVGTPEYNPLDPDVVLKEDLRTYQTLAERDSVSDMTKEKKTTTNLTLTNIRKDRVGAKAAEPHFYDIENFSLSYAYNRERSSDDELQYFNKDQHRGTLNYAFSIQPTEVKPFSKVKLFQKKNWKFMKDFNFFYQPKNMTFSTEVFRDYEETMLRNKSAALVIMKPTFYKQFTWRRDYGLQYDLARSFHIQYTANANARIEEPVGRIETRSASDSIWQSILTGGTMSNYQQQVNLTWDVPVSKLPYLDFLRMPVSYRTNYQYQGTTLALASLGSTLQSATTMQVGVQGSMQTFYNKFKLIKQAYAQDRKNVKPAAKGKDALNKDKDKPDLRAKLQPSDSTRNQDSLRHALLMEKLMQIHKFGVRFVTCVKDFNIQYSSTSGSILPGYMGEATIFGLDPSAGFTPGLGYVLGYNTSNLVEALRQDDLLSRDSLLNTPHQNTLNSTLAMQMNIEPIRDLKIKLECSQNYSSREEYYYKYNTATDLVEGPLSYIMTGSYTTTIWSFPTLFSGSNELFDAFLANRAIVAQRLADANSDGYSDLMVYDSILGQYYPAGYSANSQTVLLTSFLATYLGKDPDSYGFSPFMNMPLPNWTVNYTGLNKVQFLKKWFTNISLSHRYVSTYSIGSFYTDAALSGIDGYDYGAESVLNGTGDYIAPVSMDGVQISEQFNPLIRVSVNMVNSLQFNFSMQKNRMLALSFINNQMTETTRDGITFGGGYRFKDVELHVKFAERVHDLKSDVVLQLNLTYNNNKTEIRKINQGGLSQPSSGSQVWMAELSGEYALSTALTFRAFFQTNINRPWVQNSVPNSTTKGGITLRFSF